MRQLDTNYSRKRLLSAVEIRAGQLVCIAILAGLVLAAGEHTVAATPGSSRLVLAGLRRTSQESERIGAESVAEARELFSIIHHALEFRLDKPIVSDAELARLIGPRYLDKLLACAGDRACIRQLLIPLRAAGPATAVSVDYTVINAIYHFRVVVFRLDEESDKEAATQELVFELERVQARDPAQWRERVAGITGLEQKLSAATKAAQDEGDAALAEVIIPPTACRRRPRLLDDRPGRP